MPADEISFQVRGTASQLGRVPVRKAERDDWPDDHDIPTYVARFSVRDIALTYEGPETTGVDSRDDVTVTATTSRSGDDPIAQEVGRLLERRDEPAGVFDVESYLHGSPVWRAARFVFDDLRGAAERLVGLARWRFGALEPDSPLEAITYSVRRGREEWLDVSTGVAGWPQDLWLGDGQYLFERDVWKLQELLDAEAHEPLERSLLVRAAGLVRSNPEASLVLAVAAAEVGTKRLAGRLRRESEAWVLSELPSPSIDKLLEKHVPMLTDKRTKDGRAIPKELRKEIRSASEARNTLVHKGLLDEEAREHVPETLRAVSDLLYLLDWLAGNEWALAYVTEERRSQYPENG